MLVYGSIRKEIALVGKRESSDTGFERNTYFVQNPVCGIFLSK